MKDGFIQAFRKGNAITRLSAIILGLGNLAGKQIIKGILYLAMEVSFICFMIFKGMNCLAMLPSLGGREQQEIWNEKLGVYEYVAGDKFTSDTFVWRCNNISYSSLCCSCYEFGQECL